MCVFEKEMNNHRAFCNSGSGVCVCVCVCLWGGTCSKWEGEGKLLWWGNMYDGILMYILNLTMKPHAVACSGVEGNSSRRW
jgi:hypothetical protein